MQAVISTQALDRFAVAAISSLFFMGAALPPAAKASPIDTSGLIGYWGFEGGTGDTVLDESGHGLTGLIQGAPASDSGMQGKAMAFDGKTRVTVPYRPAMALKEWTLMCWVKTKESTHHQALISRQPPAGSPIDFRMHLSGSVGDGWGTPAGRVVPGYWNSTIPESTFAIGKSNVCDGSWHHVVGIYKPGRLLVYVDGRPDGSRIAPASPLANDSEPLTLGASDYGDGSYFLKGTLDEVRIYAYAWSDSQVAADYDRYARPPEPAKSLVAHYDFDQSSGSILLDRSGNGHDGTITGALWTQGVHGNALRFNGIDNRVLVPFASDLNTPEFTLEAWIRTDEKTHDQAIIDRVEPDGSHWNYRLMVPSRIHEIEGHSVEPGVVQSDLRNEFTSHWDVIALGQTKVTTGRWRHIAATFKDRVFRIYVDGIFDATKSVTIDAVTSSTQPLLLGDCSFTPIQFHFRGDMDEVSVWNRALTAEEIAAEAARFAVKAPEVNLGMKSYFGKAGDTLWVPLYLANYEADSLSAAQFYLEYDPAVATLLDVKADSGLARKWPLLDWNPAQAGEAKVALGGATAPLGYGEGELVRFKFLIRVDAAAGATTAMELANENLDEKGLIKVTNLPGRLTVAEPSILYGDVTGNGEVDLFDAQKIIEHVIGKLRLPDPDYPGFTLAVADVSGNGEITSYDAALVFQYSLGLIDHFPVQTPKAKSASAPSLAKSSAQGTAASLSLAAPVQVEGSRYRYRLTGSALKGLLAGELGFEVSDPIQGFLDFKTGVQGARIAPLFQPEKGRLAVVLSTSDDLDEENVDFIDIEAEHKAGMPGSGLKLVSAYLDEGKFADAGVPSKPLSAARLGGAGRPARTPFLARAGGSVVIAAVPGRPLRLDVFDVQGRKTFTRIWPAAPAEVRLPASAFPAGKVWIRARIDGSVETASLLNLEP
jgi:hypothetical protein